MKKLILGLMITLYGISVNASDTFTVDGIKYEKISSTYVRIVGWNDDIPSIVNIGSIKYLDKLYYVGEIGQNGFHSCKKNISITLPECITVETGAFEGCENLTVCLPNSFNIKQCAFVSSKLKYIIVSSEMKSQIMSNPTYYGLSNADNVRCLLYEYDIQDMQYGIFLKDRNKKDVDENDYIFSCEHYGITPIQKPQIVQDDEIAVKKETIVAPSAGTVKVEDNKVQLGVTVLKTSDLTAEKKEWGEVTLTADDVKVVDGKIVISVPVDSASGFMILQSGDAKVSADGNLEHTGIGPGGTVFPSADKE